MKAEIYIGLPYFEQTLVENGIKEDINNIKAEFIIKTVCELFDVNISNVISKSQLREFVLPRQISMYFIRYKTTLSLRKIGSYFSNKDHSTVINSCDLVTDLCRVDKAFKEKIYMIMKELEQCN